MVAHPWHEVPVGKDAPRVVNAIVEIPKDSVMKYEIDKETGMLMLDRFLFSSAYYPADYGFIPQTLWEDGDPLDIFILTARPTYPNVLCKARVLGVIRMIDQDEKDDKILAIHDVDPRFKEWNSIKDVPSHILKEIHNFLERYKELEKKTVKVFEILGPEDAYKDIAKGQKAYQAKFGKKKA